MIYKHEAKCEIALIKDEMSLKAKEHGFGVLKEYSFKELLNGYRPTKGFFFQQYLKIA